MSAIEEFDEAIRSSSLAAAPLLREARQHWLRGRPGYGRAMGRIQRAEDMGLVAYGQLDALWDAVTLEFWGSLRRQTG